MRDLKFRQAIFINGQFSHFHYWGFYLPAWIPPNLDYTTPEVALANSQQYTGLKDTKTLTDIYEGDIIDMEGNIRGNIYESPEVYKTLSACVVAGMGYEDWENTKQRLVRQGKLIAEQSNLPQILQELG